MKHVKTNTETIYTIEITELELKDLLYAITLVTGECPCSGDGEPGSALYGEHLRADHQWSDIFEGLRNLYY